MLVNFSGPELSSFVKRKSWSDPHIWPCSYKDKIRQQMGKDFVELEVLAIQIQGIIIIDPVAQSGNLLDTLSET